MLPRLGFALPWIGDPRAAPVLILAIPKTLLPASTDHGLIVGDKGLGRVSRRRTTSTKTTEGCTRDGQGTHPPYTRHAAACLYWAGLR